jgi:hypothetical protein
LIVGPEPVEGVVRGHLWLLCPTLKFGGERFVR